MLDGPRNGVNRTRRPINLEGSGLYKMGNTYETPPKNWALKLGTGSLLLLS
jgi:hypothetical protein